MNLVMVSWKWDYCIKIVHDIIDYPNWLVVITAIGVERVCTLNGLAPLQKKEVKIV